MTVMLAITVFDLNNEYSNMFSVNCLYFIVMLYPEKQIPF